MSQPHVEDASAPALPCPVPARYPTEPRELTSFRSSAADEKSFLRLRKVFREAEDWKALATLLVVHAAAMQRDPNLRTKASELCMQAYELLLDRVKDRDQAAHALARAVLLRPDNTKAIERLRKLYETQGAGKELVILLRWRLEHMPDGPEAVPLHLELAELLDEQFMALGEAAEHLERALASDPQQTQATDRLLSLYETAGAWTKASDLLRATIARLDRARDPERVADLHRRLAAIESEHLHDVAAAARDLQAALQAVPDDVEALRAFGVLYLASDKATEDSMSKAADIFYKAAELTRRRGDSKRALKLLRRALQLAPDHQQASAALERTLIESEDWMALDDLYREWQFHYQGADAVPLLLRRADLLDRRLARREEARQLYEEASRYQRPDDESWRRLERLYEESKDFHALAGLLEAQVDRLPDDVPIQTLLRAATVYRDELGLEEKAAVYYYKVLEREPFNGTAFEGYKEHWRRKHNWSHLRDLIQYQIDQAAAHPEDETPLRDPAFAEEFAEVADICERRLGDIDGALEVWRRMQTAYPNDPRPPKHIARIEKRARMWDNMVRVQEAELERAVDPAKRLDILKRLTQVYRDRQVNPQRAIELYNEILELSPNDIQATRALTALYDRAGDHEAVIGMLRDQYDRSRSNTERTALLRRMAEIWHHELESPDEAIWACQQILEMAPSDKDALVRLQQIYEDQGRWGDLLTALERELGQQSSADGKAKVLRYMAHIAEHELRDDDKAAALWNRLADLRAGDLEIADRLATVYERSGRLEELAGLLGKLAAAPGTPEIRQVDLLLRLGYLAETSLDDVELAKSAFERVVRARPDHRGALEALVRLYRREDAWRPLVAVLGKLQEVAETDEDAFRIAWERSEILAEHLDAPDAAAEVLERAQRVGLGAGRTEVAQSLLDLFERSGQHRKQIRQAELMLLATTDADERRRLYRSIAKLWRETLAEPRAALAVYARFADEFEGDVDVLWVLANLQDETGDTDGAIATLQRRLESAIDTQTQTKTLLHMADLAERRLEDPARALEYLRRALAGDHFNTAIVERIDQIARVHQLWTPLLQIFEERFGHLHRAGLGPGQLELGLEAAEVAEAQAGDPPRAFDWARRAYFVALESDLARDSAYARLEALADRHNMWGDLLAVIDREIEFFDKRGEASYDAVSRLLVASTIAEDRLHDPTRAVGLLQRAHRLRPTDEELAARLESTAERYRLWQAVIEVWGGRLSRANTGLARFDACAAIARIYEDELADPEKAFEWLQKAWRDLRDADDKLAPKLSDEAFDRLLALADRKNLWPQLCQHHLDRAADAKRRDNVTERLAALQDAAVVFDERLDDPLGALRVLASGIDDDPGGDRLLPEIRRLSERVDEREAKRDDASSVKLGASCLLLVLQDVIAGVETDIEKVQLLEERAEVRERRQSDTAGAVAEWLRILRLDPEYERGRTELRRLAEAHDLWSGVLCEIGWRLEQADDDEDQAKVLLELAGLYEHPLQRPEYALRARLAAWRRRPELPPVDGPLPDPHPELWRLAEQTGAYRTPPVPRDPLLSPVVEVPEIADQGWFEAAGVDPVALLRRVPSPYQASSPPATIAPLQSPGSVLSSVRTGDTEPVSIDEGPSPVQAGFTHRVDLVDEDDDEPRPEAAIDEIEELAFEELEELDIDDDPGFAAEEGPTVAAGLESPVHGEGQDPTIALGKRKAGAPPPPPKAIDAGLVPVPRLSGPLLPPRPRVASAWEELALAYAEVPTVGTNDRARVALVLARLWERGAGNIERAFAAFEQALVWLPEDTEALRGLRALADRHEALDRLLQAYVRLLGEATMPEHVVQMGLRIARLHEERGELLEAERRYRGVLDVMPRHVAALRSLAEIYRKQERAHEYTDAYAALLDAEEHELSDDAIVERTLELAGLLSERGNRKKDALERLELLARRFPERRDAHEALIAALQQQRKWQRAIDAMRAAAEAVYDETFRRENLARSARIYEEQLNLPDRAIAAWAELVEDHDDPEGLERLQALYLQTGRYEPALPIIERRLGLLDAADGQETGTARTSLLVAKARVLQEGMGDEAAAASTLEQLLRDDPDNDEVALGLGRLYRNMGRLEEGIALLRRRWEAMPAEPRERFVKATSALADVLDRDGHDPKGALTIVQDGLERTLAAGAPSTPDDPWYLWLVRVQARLARTLHDRAMLAESLAKLPDADALLEAADLFRMHLQESARALRLYSRVLAESRQNPDDPESGRRLAAALEGLVKLRLSAGDAQGAMDFMDEQLAQVEGRGIRAQLLTEMGRITYRTTGDIVASRRRFNAALREDPEYARAKLGLGEVLLQAGSAAEAEALLEQALESLGLQANPEDQVHALVLLAKVLEQGGRSGEAYRRLTMAARHAPESVEIRAAIVRNRFNAKRWRDTVTAADQLEQQLGEGLEQREKLAPVISEVLVLAAKAELELRQPDRAVVRLRRSVELQPNNEAALEPLAALSQERGALAEAARHMLALGRVTEDAPLRGRRYLDAGMLYHDAAAALADGAEPTGDEREADLRKAAFETLRLGLQTLRELDRPGIDRGRLEAVFRAAADHDPPTALQALDSLLRHVDVRRVDKEALHLEGARIAMAAGDLALAETHADAARKLAPASSAAVLMKAEVLEASDRPDEVEPLVAGYFDTLDHSQTRDDDAAARVALLLRLAEIQRSHPRKAITALERAWDLDATALGATERRRLAELYEEVEQTGSRVIDNHVLLLGLEPLHQASLAALAAHYAVRGELGRAYAIHRVLLLVDPDDPTARAFTDAHEEVQVGNGELEYERFVPPAPSGAGVPEALLLLWEGGAAVLGDYLPRVEVPQEARISPLGDNLLAKTWGELLKRLGQSKVALVDDSALVLDDRDVPDAARDVGFFHLHCQHPPIIVAKQAARTTRDRAALRFALGRAVYFSRPEAIFAAGLRRIKLAQLLSATLQAFHPRHGRRKHHQRQEDFVARLSQELARKLPMRIARQLTALFKDHENEPFDSSAWRSWVRAAGNRVGLVLGGDIDAAVGVLLEDRERLPERVASEDDLRDLVAFAGSAEFVDARHKLGFTIRQRIAEAAVPTGE